MSGSADWREVSAAGVEAVARRIEAALDARSGERFERTSGSGLCKATVDLRQRLVDFQFLRADAMREFDRRTLAEEAASTIAAAQDEARAEADRIAAEIYDELGFS
jgi:hypothetical protein